VLYDSQFLVVNYLKQSREKVALGPADCNSKVDLTWGTITPEVITASTGKNSFLEVIFPDLLL
jgi:hypothetical protein